MAWMQGLESGIKSSKGPPWSWEETIPVLEEVLRLGDMPAGTQSPVTQTQWEKGWDVSVSRATGNGKTHIVNFHDSRVHVAGCIIK